MPTPSMRLQPGSGGTSPANKPGTSRRKTTKGQSKGSQPQGRSSIFIKHLL